MKSKKDSTEVDKKHNIEGGDVAGDDVGVMKVGDGAGKRKAQDVVVKHLVEVELEDEFGCKICGKIGQTKAGHIEHLNEEHSTGAILIAADVINKNMNRIEQGYKFDCEICQQSFVHILTLQAHLKNIHEDKGTYHCNFCGNVCSDSEDLKSHIEIKHGIKGGGEKRPSVLSDSSDDSSDDESTNDNTNSQIIYKEDEWGNEENISEPPIGRNFKSKHEMFAVSATKLKKLYRKNSIKIVGENTIHVVEVERKGTSIEATVQIEDKGEKGQIRLTFWGPNKKTKETTIQVNTTKGSAKRFVNLFSDIFLKPLIERVSNGIGIGNFFKKQGNCKRVCDVCKVFKMDLNDHKIKKHNASSSTLKKVLDTAQQQNTDNASTKCDTCEFVADNKIHLKEHIENVHNSEFWLVGPKRRKKDNNKEDSDITDIQSEKVNENEDEMSLTKRRDKQILAKRDKEEQEEEKRKKKAEEKRLQDLIIEENKNRAKSINKRKRKMEGKLSKEKEVNISETNIKNTFS